MQTILKKAGSFDVEYIPCPYYAGPTDFSAPRTGVLHTTEGGYIGSLQIFKQHFAPHFLIDSSYISQLVPIGMSGAALVTHNNIALVQIEVVAYSKEDPWFLDDATAQRVASVLATCNQMFGIPLSRPFADGVWGKAGDNPNRHAGHWGTIPGWYGHGDVPSPDTHWDPGNFQWSKLFGLAASLSLPSLQEPTGPVGHPATPLSPNIQLPDWPPLGDRFFDLAARAMKQWIALGYTLPIALGLTARIELECAFHVTAVGDHGTAFGAFQWHSPRREAILKATGIDVSQSPNIEDHIKAAHWELNNTERPALMQIEQAQTAAEAGQAVCRYYVRAGASGATLKTGAAAERWAVYFSAHPELLK